jgi:hypothetical protein
MVKWVGVEPTGSVRMAGLQPAEPANAQPRLSTVG